MVYNIIYFKVGRPCIPQHIRSPQHVFYFSGSILTAIMLKGRIGDVWYSPEGELGSVAFACSKSSLILARMIIVAVWDFIIPIRSILLKK